MPRELLPVGLATLGNRNPTGNAFTVEWVIVHGQADLFQVFGELHRLGRLASGLKPGQKTQSARR